MAVARAWGFHHRGRAMLHEPAAPSGKDYGTAYKTKLGVVMFILYGLIYAGFVAINVIDAKLMEMTVLWGLNLAIVYGMGLILFALVLAMIYNAMCTGKENALRAQDPEAEGNA